MSAWQKLPNFKEQGFPFSSWLYTIARNKVIDHYRTKKGHQSLDDESLLNSELFGEANQAEEDFDANLSLKKVTDALAHLSAQQREVITMRFVDDLSPAEIDTILNKREGTIRIIQHRAINKLKKIIHERSIS